MPNKFLCSVNIPPNTLWILWEVFMRMLAPRKRNLYSVHLLMHKLPKALQLNPYVQRFHEVLTLLLCRSIIWYAQIGISWSLTNTHCISLSRCFEWSTYYCGRYGSLWKLCCWVMWFWGQRPYGSVVVATPPHNEELKNLRKKTKVIAFWILIVLLVVQNMILGTIQFFARLCSSSSFQIVLDYKSMW